MQTLAAELLGNILTHIDHDSDRTTSLRNLRLTCRALADAAAPHLFQKVGLPVYNFLP